MLQYLKPLQASKDWEKWVAHLAWQMQMDLWCYLKELQEKKRKIRGRTNNFAFIINYHKRSFVLGLDLQAKWGLFCSGWCKTLFGRKSIIVFAVCFSFSEDASLRARVSTQESPLKSTQGCPWCKQKLPRERVLVPDEKSSPCLNDQDGSSAWSLRRDSKLSPTWEWQRTESIFSCPLYLTTELPWTSRRKVLCTSTFLLYLYTLEKGETKTSRFSLMLS